MRFLVVILLLCCCARVGAAGPGYVEGLVVSSCGGGAVPSGALTNLTMEYHFGGFARAAASWPRRSSS